MLRRINQQQIFEDSEDYDKFLHILRYSVNARLYFSTRFLSVSLSATFAKVLTVFGNALRFDPLFSETFFSEDVDFLEFCDMLL